MKISNALMLGLAVVSFTFCKKQEDDLKPKDKFSNEAKISATSYTKFDYIIKPGQWKVDAKELNLPEGAVVGIEAGTRGALLLANFVGAPGKPITIVNKGGKMTIKSTGSYGLKVENCKHIRITGTGDNNFEKGFEINGGHIGMSMDKLSTNFEIDHLEIHNSGFAGVMAKTDPSCDQATWNGNFVMRDISIHDNYVHAVKGEGFYIGNSFYKGGRNLSCGSIQPHAIEGLRLYNNKVRNSGCEGIQVGCVVKDCEIFNNDVADYGQDPFANYQNNGIQIGEGTGGKLYNNIVKNGPGNGIIMLGLGDNVVFNNVVINAGQNGVFIDERYTPGPGFTFVNNTFINPGNDGFKVYSEKVSYNKIINNIVVSPGSGKYITTMGGPNVTDQNNLFTNNIAEVKFVNAPNGDYNLQAGSPAVDKGADLSSLGVRDDYRRVSRPQGSGFDIGAFEYSGSAQPAPSPAPAPAPAPTPGPTDPAPAPAPAPDQPVTQPAGQKVVSFTLVDAKTNRDIATITNGYEINLATIGTSEFNIRANTNPTNAGSVVFNYNGTTSSQSWAPFALFGDAGVNNYHPGTLNTGTHTLTATAFTGTKGTGTKGGAHTVRFTVVNKPNGTPAQGNRAPSISPVNSQSMTEGETKVIDITTADLDNDAVRVTVSNLPVFAILQQNASGAKLTFKPGTTHAGSYNMTIKADDGRGGINTVSFTLQVNEKAALTNATFKATDDVYFHGTQPRNSHEIRVEYNTRKSYLKFNVQGLGSASPNKAILRVKVDADNGNGPLRVFAGSHNNWTERNISTTSAPAKVSQVGFINTTYNRQTVYEIDVTQAIKGDGTYTLILDKDAGGNDVSFMTKESGFAPELIIN